MKAHVLLVMCGVLTFVSACSGDSPMSGSNPASSARKTVNIGEVVTDGPIEFQVTEVRTASAVGGAFLSARASEGGTYVIVRYSIKNRSNKPLSVFEVPTPALVDPRNTEYSPDLNATASYASVANLDAKALSDLNPGITTKDAQVYEVSRERFSDAWRVKLNDIVVRLQSKDAGEGQASRPQLSAATEGGGANTEDASIGKAGALSNDGSGEQTIEGHIVCHGPFVGCEVADISFNPMEDAEVSEPIEANCDLHVPEEILALPEGENPSGCRIRRRVQDGKLVSVSSAVRVKK